MDIKMIDIFMGYKKMLLRTENSVNYSWTWFIYKLHIKILQSAVYLTILKVMGPDARAEGFA